MDRIGKRIVREDIGALRKGWGGAGLVGAEHRYGVSDAGREMERHADAHVLWRKSISLARRHGARGQESRASLNAGRRHGRRRGVAGRLPNKTLVGDGSDGTRSALSGLQ
jgi:hypothetical protein